MKELFSKKELLRLETFDDNKIMTKLQTLFEGLPNRVVYSSNQLTDNDAISVFKKLTKYVDGHWLLMKVRM